MALTPPHLPYKHSSQTILHPHPSLFPQQLNLLSSLPFPPHSCTAGTARDAHLLTAAKIQRKVACLSSAEILVF